LYELNEYCSDKSTGQHKFGYPGRCAILHNGYEQARGRRELFSDQVLKLVHHFTIPIIPESKGAFCWMWVASPTSKASKTGKRRVSKVVLSRLNELTHDCEWPTGGIEQKQWCRYRYCDHCRNHELSSVTRDICPFGCLTSSYSTRSKSHIDELIDHTMASHSDSTLYRTIPTRKSKGRHEVSRKATFRGFTMIIERNESNCTMNRFNITN
jgi:hypothetical protein